MIDLKLLQKDFESMAEPLKKKGVDDKLLDELKALALNAKAKRQEMENVTSEQNKLSKEFGRYKKEKLDIAPLQKSIGDLKTKKQTLEDEVRVLEDEMTAIALGIPNLPDDSVPVGADEDENVVLEVIGEKPKFSFEPKEHWDLGEKDGSLDFERGVKLSKSRFVAMRGQAAKLERALINYMLDFNTGRGFEEWYVPFMANTNTLEGTGQLPKFEDDLFKIEGEDLYLIPTAEVPLTNIYRDVLLNDDELPIKLTAHTPCFRSEAGSYGRDTKGLIRQHQFEKIELFKISNPSSSMLELEGLLENAEEILQLLELPYQVVQLCAGDIGFSSCKTYDIEVWMPSQNKYREISSCSNFGDFQARRSNIKFKSDTGKSFVHTINGSGLAVGRTLIALLENRFNDGDFISLPRALEPYFGSSKLEI